MSPEKIIKRQAREALKGNAVTLIAAAGAVLLTALLLNYLNITTVFLLESNGVLGTAPQSPGHIIVKFCYGAALMLLSPLFNGCLRMAASVARGRQCCANELFFFFGTAHRYSKTLVIDMILLLYLTPCAAIMAAGEYAGTVLAEQLPAWEYSANLFPALTGIVAALICVPILAVFVHYPLAAYALNENIPIEHCVFLMIAFSARNLGKTLRLVFSFAGWAALCFFVLPALYVIPYFAVTSIQSAKWLFELEENRGIAE